jgi:protoporphyrinogen oxidase
VRVAVVGGGLAGLSAALELTDAGADVTVLEAGDRFGGQVRTTRERGFVIEEGADGFDPTNTALHGLVRDLRLEDDLLSADPLPTLILERRNGTRVLKMPGAASEALVPNLTFRSGMGALVRALVRRLEGRADLRIGNAAVALSRASAGWIIYPEMGPALSVDAITVALPPRPAAWLIHPISSEAAHLLSGLNARSLIVVTLAYRRHAVSHPLNAAGFLVPHRRGEEGLEACAFVTSSFRTRAPSDAILLRTVLRPARGELVSTTDDGWTDGTHAMLAPVLGLAERPRYSWVARWADAVPVVEDDRREQVALAMTSLRAWSRIELAGASYTEPGLEGALRSGREAARRILAG